MLKCLKNQGKDEQRTRRNYGNVHGTAQWRLLTPHARSSCWSTRKKNPEKQRAKATNRKAATELPTADKPVKECSPYVRIKEVHVVTILPTWGKQKRNRVLVTVWGFGHHPTGRGKKCSPSFGRGSKKHLLALHPGIQRPHFLGQHRSRQISAHTCSLPHCLQHQNTADNLPVHQWDGSSFIVSLLFCTTSTLYWIFPKCWGFFFFFMIPKL